MVTGFLWTPLTVYKDPAEAVAIVDVHTATCCCVASATFICFSVRFTGTHTYTHTLTHTHSRTHTHTHTPRHTVCSCLSACRIFVSYLCMFEFTVTVGVYTVGVH
eukprot:GHVQ01040495.1.p2 GENE.GHVQ01040495.1~~GHVQ01040495.1.p2  ORF type:complete len:105 (+),score=15.65 GHVQ01040495.1:85-399(+)